MDYDDNDFQGQNLHLAGEGSSKFPPVLQPYALPKFDFDDSLPGHLRFDSLVENEVFLGIPSQEDNQWIEDFSRGSSGIEFGSSAAESCSISRHNNVWSEATSSESVEMLLKSVGQEEMVPGETIIEESDACDELGSLTKQMESNSRQGDEKKDVIESHPASPPDECLEHLSGLNESAVEVTLQTQEMLSAYGSKNELNPNTVSEKGGLFVAEKNSEIDGECNENQSKVDISADESLDDIIHKNPSVSGIQIHEISSVDAVASVSKQASNINAESLSGVPKDIGDGLEEDHVTSKRDIADDENLKGTKAEAGTYNLENSLVYSSIMECTEGHEGETNISNSEEPSRLALKEDGDLQKAESNIKDQAIDVRNIQDGVCGSSEIGSPMQIIHGQSISVEKEENFLASDCQFNSQASVSNSEASLFSGQGNKLSNDQGDGNGNSHEGDLRNLTVECTSAELLRVKHVTENLEGVNDASAIHKDPNAEDHVSPSMSVMQISERDFDSKEGGVYHNHHGAFNIKENVKPPSDSSSLNFETFGPLIVETSVQSTSSAEGINGKDTMDHELEYDTSARNKPALEVSLENTEHKTLDGVPSAYEINDQSKEQKSTVHAGVVMALDKKKETKFEVSTEGSLPTHLHGASEQGSVSGVEKGACEDSAGQLMRASGVETCNAASQSEPAMVSDEVSQDDSKKLEVSHDGGEELLILENHEETVVEKDHEELSSEASVLVPSKSEVFTDPEPVSLVDSGCNMAQKECETNEAIAASGVNDYGKTTPITEVDTSDNRDANCAAEIGGCSSGSEKANCGSPTIISSYEVCHSEKDGQADVNKVKSTSENPIENDAAKDQRSFTFEVSPSVGLSESETSKGWQSFPTIKACKISTVVEGSPTTSGAGQFVSKTASEISRRTARATDGDNSRGGSKGTPERKARRVSAKGTRKENTKRGNQGTPPTSLSISPSATGQLVQLEGLKPYRNVEPNGTKPCGVISIPTSNLPDLNSSTPPSALFQQPFTDLQQVQLRAQIFVYGSLIQGAAPDEACMISAFGTPDGGRSIWEPAWHACVEKIQGQKSHSNNVETPLQSRSGARVADQATKQTPIQSKVLSSPVGRAGSKSTPPSPVVNSMIPLSSPLWTMSTASCDALQSVGLVRGPVLDYHQALSSLHSYQTPPTRNFVGHNASWLSQAPFPGAWVASPQTSAFDASSRFSMLPITESVKLTPIKESSVPISSGTKHASPSPVVHSGVPSVFVGTSQQIDMKKTTQSPGQKSTDPKSRKRKKVQVSEDIGQISLLAQTQTQSVSTPLVTGHLSTSIVVSTPAVLSTSSNDDSKRGDQNAEKKVVIAEESFSKDEVAEAEEASALASAAVNHSQSVLSHLDKQKNSGLISDIEAKLASAAVTISAAVAVVNAAALATKIASNAVLQAKLMANEALGLSGSSVSPLDAANNLGIASHASSIIVAAREAVRRRVEAASAASKHAENLDAIVKAAELAAEAVSQAGKVVAMGDPLPLNVPSEQGAKSEDVNKEQSHVDRVDEGPAISAKRSKVGPRTMEIQTTNQVMQHLSGAVTSSENDLRAQRGFRASDLAKTIGVVPGSEIGPSAGTSKETSIKEGCLVEVFKDGDDTKAAWFSAKVLSLKDGNVFVCYNELLSDEGPRSEWVALEGNSAPRIRITHPINTMRLEGARKRRRAALGDYAWSVGDKVDAWVENCWREGVVTEKSAKDETTLTVRFPAEGETSLVRAWHLRPTLIWKDGEWIEWSSSREKDRASLGDTPKEKRLKLGGPDVEGKEEVSKNVDLMESGRPGESSLLPLSSNEQLFNVGLHTIDENKPHTLGTIRTGLQKERSKVIFGVPKPGKKRKFMDVSKHYDVAERNTKNTKLSDSISLAKYLMPQGSGSRGSRNNSKIDSKEKQPGESKSKALKPGKPQIGFGRSIPQKDKFPSSVVSSNVGPTKDHVTKDTTSRQTELGSLSSIEEASEGPILFSSQALPSDARSKIFTSKAKSERSNKGRLAPSGTRSSKPEVKDNVYNRNPEKPISDAAEPRRSNRRIQPTSRLLEGLQSSLVIAKFPASHDKSNKTHSRGISKGNNHGGDELPK